MQTGAARARNVQITHLMTQQKPSTLSRPTGDKLQARLVSQRLWRWFIEPSPRITEPDQRRQASLLMGFLVGSIVLASVLEIVTTLLNGDPEYTGYRQTIISLLILALVYA